MAKWQRFGDGTWVNVDHVEVVRVEEDDDGGWQLTASFASGSTHALGRADGRELLVDCTDVLLRDEVGEHLRALTDTPDTPGTPVTPVTPAMSGASAEWATFHRDLVPDPTPNRDENGGAVDRTANATANGPANGPANATATGTATRRGWRFWRPANHDGPAAQDPADAAGHPAGVQLHPVG